MLVDRIVGIAASAEARKTRSGLLMRARAASLAQRRNPQLTKLRDALDRRRPKPADTDGLDLDNYFESVGAPPRSRPPSPTPISRRRSGGRGSSPRGRGHPARIPRPGSKPPR